MNDQNPARNCLVLLQNREDTAYNDFIGKFYHFPQKYLKLLSVPDAEFIYYEPKKKGEGVYFGYGKILKIFPDKREEGCYFAELAEYKPFSKPVAFVSDDGKPRESGDTYNAQNAVRRVTDDVLDGICLDGGIILNFKADAHLLTVLGEQLISSEQVGILELVKNAYDAGATACTVRIEAISSLPAKESEYQYQQYPGPVIVIRDNGRGMDRFTIEHGWLRPASTIKTDIKERLKKERQEAIARKSVRTFDKLVKALKTEHGGRLPLGEKGVGRFASHRLGRCVVIKTKTAADNFEYVLSIDWDRFNAAEGGEFINLDSVGIALFRSVPSRDYGPSSSGTEIIIHSGRPEYPITIDTIKQIHGTIRNLCSPSNGPQDFKVDFECPQAGNQDEVKYSDQLHPVFSLDALVDEEGIADIDKYFTPPRSVPLNAEAKKKIPWDLRLSEPGHWKGDNDADALRKPSCGRFILHLDLWYRTTPWLEGADYKDFIKHLNDYGGISIFRDGLNVFPAEWGAEMDWLELGKRHIQKGDRLSYREMIGNLEIEQTANLLLVDKTDRQGMIKNEAYRDLAKLVKALVIYIENDFQGKREKFNELDRKSVV